MKIKNVYCPICHRRTYFTGKVVYESERTEVIEWKCSECGAIIKSRHDKLGKKYSKIAGRRTLNSKPVLWTRKGGYWESTLF